MQRLIRTVSAPWIQLNKFKFKSTLMTPWTSHRTFYALSRMEKPKFTVSQVHEKVLSILFDLTDPKYHTPVVLNLLTLECIRKPSCS